MLYKSHYLWIIHHPALGVCVPPYMLLFCFSLLYFSFFFLSKNVGFFHMDSHQWKLIKKSVFLSRCPNKWPLQCPHCYAEFKCSCILLFRCISYVTIKLVELSWVQCAHTTIPRNIKHIVYIYINTQDYHHTNNSWTKSQLWNPSPKKSNFTILHVLRSTIHSPTKSYLSTRASSEEATYACDLVVLN